MFKRLFPVTLACILILLHPFQGVSQAALQGTISGSNTCNGAPGLLTFHTQSGTGPFSIVYSDGVNTYTQTGVANGVPFPVQVQPTVSTVYSLVSIQDASGSPPVTTAAGITATINPGSCTLCTGALGDPVINVTFGSGNGNAPSLETLVPGASSTNLTFVAVSGNPATPIPLDGQYTITNNIPANSNWFLGSPDHTPGDVNGYMLFENAGMTPGEFFRQTVTGLCSSTKYEFAAWIANADNPAAAPGLLNPDLTFIVQTADGTVLDTYNSGPVPQTAVFTWQQYGFFFTLPAGVSSVIVRIIDNNPGGTAQPGNDFAIDDITFRPCGPLTTASFSSTSSITHADICEGGSATLYGGVAGGYVSPQYLWQESADSGKTWTDITTAATATGNLQLLVTPPVATKAIDYYYRAVTGDGSNVQSAGCRVASNVIVLSLHVPPDAGFNFTQNVCDPLQVNFTGVTQPGVSYTWNIEGNDHTGGAPGNPNFPYTFTSYNVYPITLKVSDGFCSNSASKSIGVELQPAAIILQKDTGICVGSGVLLKTAPSLEFCWSPTAGLDNPASASPVATPTVTTQYTFTARAIGQNLVVNGDFEAGNTGFITDYTYTSNGFPESTCFVSNDPNKFNSSMPHCTDHTSGKGNMLLVNGSPTLNTRAWQETITVTPNTDYAFSVWIESISTGNPAVLQFSINGQALGNPIDAILDACNWKQFYTVWNSGASTTAVISVVNQNSAYSGNDFALDDISFGPIAMQQGTVLIDVETPVVQASPSGVTVCPGTPVQLSATGSLNYTWSPAAGLSDATIAGPVATPAVSTQYTVTGVSARGCKASDMATVNLFPKELSISNDTMICKGDAASLSATGGLNYTWSPAATLDDPASATPAARPDVTTRYYLSIVDGNQCTETDSVTVSIKAIPLFQQPLWEDVCDGYSVALKSGNAGSYRYVWTPAVGLDDPTAPYPIASPAATTTYYLHISDSVCAAYSNDFSVLVTVKPNPLITASKDNDIDCSIHTAQLRGNGGVSYSWTPVTGLNDPLAENPIASIDTSTLYRVKGVAENGCYAFDTIRVKVTAVGANTFLVPNAFTPNGDGRNDCFGLTRWGDVQVEQLSIFNRWGLMIFSTQNPSDCWDGTYKGVPQPTGAYVYVIRARTICGPVTRMGTVMLIR